MSTYSVWADENPRPAGRKGEVMLKKSKIRLLIVAAVLTVAALTTATAQAECVFYCWHGPDGQACCQTWTCEIIC
jgi:hypothetical protein